MNDAHRVARGETVEHRVRNPEDLRHRHHAAALLPRLADRLPLQKVHHQERLRVLGHVVVEDTHAGRVADAVGHVRFAEEAIADDAVTREVGVEDLERRPLAVAV